MAELDFIARTATIGKSLAAQRAITTGGGVLEWETNVWTDALAYTLTDSDRRIQVAQAGRYLARYDFGAQRNPFLGGTPTRAGVRSTLRVNNVEQVWGRGFAYWRNAQACTDGHCSAGALLELAASDEVSVHAQRFDTAGLAGTTARSNNFEGQFSLWRLKDSWRVARAKLTADEGASSSSLQDLVFDDLESADAGWSLSSGALLFDYTAAGSAYDPASHLFLVCVSVEADVTSGTAEGLLEVVPSYDDGFGTTFEIARVTSYAEGPQGTVRVVSSWVGLIEGFGGEPSGSPERILVRYRHRNTNATTFTPKGEKCSIQVVAIPRAEIEYATGVEAAGGQAADVDAAVTYDNTGHETPGVLEHPGGDSSEIRALGLGSFVLAFATAYAAPSAARAALRLNHRLSLRREATGLAQCGHIAHNRGTNGCDRGGTNAHGIVKLTANEDVQAFQENTSNQVDTAVDLVGVETATDFLTKLQAIKLRDLGQRPHPAVLHAAAPTVARTGAIEPAAAVLGSSPPAVTRTLQLLPSPAELGIVSPAVARLVTLTPGPALLGVVAPQVARLVTLTPTPVVVPLIVPNVERLQSQNPTPAALPLVVPAVARLVTLTPTPGELEVVAQGVARLVTLTPDGAVLGVVAPVVARLVTLTPAPVELLVLVPTHLLGTIVVVELALELARACVLPAGLALTAPLAAALERAIAAQAQLAASAELGAHLPTSSELDALLQLVAEMPIAGARAAEMQAGADRGEDLRAAVARAAEAYAALLGAAHVQGDFARVLAQVVRLE